jgi:hypothetical protein
MNCINHRKQKRRPCRLRFCHPELITGNKKGGLAAFDFVTLNLFQGLDQYVFKMLKQVQHDILKSA